MRRDDPIDSALPPGVLRAPAEPGLAIDAASSPRRRTGSPWRKLTRRDFVAMIGAAAAALAVPGRSGLVAELASDELAEARARRSRRTARRKTVWIGHC